MRLVEINSEAKRELNEIVNELFLNAIDTKLDISTNTLAREINEKSRGITSKVREISSSIDKNKDDIEDLIDEFKAENVNQHVEIKKITSEGLESIHTILSKIHNENLVEILSKARCINESQKKHSEDILNLSAVIKSQKKNIKLDNLEIWELAKKTQDGLKSDIVALINRNESEQKKYYQNIGKSISDYVELEKQNKLNFQNGLEIKLQKIDETNSALIKSFNEKIEFLKAQNEKQVLKLMNRSNLGFITIFIINFSIFILMLLYYFLVLN